MSRQLPGKGRKPHKWRDRWRAYLTIGYHPDGRPNRTYVYGRTRAECQAKLDKLIEDFLAGLTGNLDGTLPLGSYLEHWLEGLRVRRSTNTVRLYQRDMNLIHNRLARKRTDKITALDVEAIMLDVHERVSADAANRVRATLRTAFEAGVRKGVLGRNPAAHVERHTHQREKATVWTGSEVLQFIRTTGEIITELPRDRVPRQRTASEHHAMFYLALTTGARSGELTALTWDDLQDGFLSITKTSVGSGRSRSVSSPKSDAGNRLLPLPDDAIEVLARHRRGLIQRGLADAGLMFPSRTGQMLDGANVGRALRSWCKKAKVTVLTPHELRHTFASMAIADGMTAVELARQLGHADPAFTMRTYAHFFDRVQAKEARSLVALSGAGGHAEHDGSGAVGGKAGGTKPDSVN